MVDFLNIIDFFFVGLCDLFFAYKAADLRTILSTILLLFCAGGGVCEVDALTFDTSSLEANS